MKRFKLFILFFLCFFVLNVNFVFASSHGGGGGNHDSDTGIEDPSGMNSWSLAEKIMYWNTNFFTVVDAILKIPTGNTTEKMDELFLRFSVAHSNKYNSYAEMLAEGTQYDEDNDEFIFDSLSMEFINFIKSSVEDEITYENRYFPTTGNLDSNSFNTRSSYMAALNLISENPDKLFSFRTSTLPNSNDVFGRYCDGLIIVVCDVPYGALTDSFGKRSACQGVTSEWSTTFSSCELYLVDRSYGTDFDSALYFYDKDGNVTIIKNPDNITANCFEGATKAPSMSETVLSRSISPVLTPASIPFETESLSPLAYSFSNFRGAIPVFNNMSDLKKGTSNGTLGQFMPGYTGQPITNNTISQQEINDFSTTYNYYYGDNSGNNPGGSGSGSGSGSSGNWLDSLLSSLGKLGDIIMTLLSKFFDVVTDIIKFFTDTLSDAMDIIPTGFVEFLGALFPFIPEEWITAVSLALALMLIGVVIKVLRNLF